MGLEDYVESGPLTMGQQEDILEVRECRACGGELIGVGTLGIQCVVDFPLSDDQPGVRAPLDLVRCDQCGLVQLGHTVNPNRLFKKFWYQSGINEQMRSALFEVVNTANSVVGTLKAGEAVLDIGSNDGTLLSAYPRNLHTVGFEPCDELVAKAKEKGGSEVLFNTYFQNGHALTELLMKWRQTGFKVITALAMFYDVPNPTKFLQDVKALLHPEGICIIQMNSLAGMLKNNAFDNICHEHLCYYSFASLESVLERAGLTVVDVRENEVNGGSMRVYITHMSSEAPWYLGAVLRMSKLRQYERIARVNDPGSICQLFEHACEISKVLSGYIMEASAVGRKIYVYGASTRGTTLLQTLNPDVYPLLLGAAERDEKKYGRVMVGSRTPIVSEVEAREKATDFLVLPWHFSESILRREQAWVQNGGRLIFPLPIPKVVDAEGERPL